MPQEMIRVPLTDVARAQLERANTEVNRQVAYTSDRRQYGVEEYWAVAGQRGDCEDYALAKMKRLRALGWPQGAFDIGICRVDGTGHAVLVAHTDQGDLVLDNNHPDLRPWNSAEYHWIECSVGGSFAEWRKVERHVA